MSSTVPIPDRFELLETLSSTEAEVLLRARDRVLQREVVLKAPGTVMAAFLSETSGRDRALREARTLARVRHPGVARLLEVLDGPLLVMEPVSGETLAERVARTGTLDAAEVTRLALDLADALGSVHAAGIAHRSLSLEAIVLRPDASCCLTGFSFAKFDQHGEGDADGDEATLAAAPAPLLPPYPAPELRQGEAADERADIFSLGSLLFRCLTGRDPFPGHEVGQAAPALEGLVPDVPAGLSAALRTSLARSPLKRFASCGEFARALRQTDSAIPLPGATKGGTGPAGAASTSPLAIGRGRWTQRPVRLVAGALALAAALLLFVRPWTGNTDVDAQDSSRASRLFIGGLPDNPLSDSYEHSHALVIGVGEAYADTRFPELANAEADARALAAHLRDMTWEGWKVRTLIGEQATRAAILAELTHIEELAGPDDRVLVFFAGHGEAHERSAQSGWAIPADARVRESDPGRSTWIDFGRFQSLFRQCGAKHILLAMDSCYSGRLSQARASGQGEFNRRLLSEKAHVVLTSGRPFEQVSDGVAGEHSPFTRAILETLAGQDEVAITSVELFTRIQREFTARGVAHTPTIAHPDGGALGQFVFFLKNPLTNTADG